MKTFFSETKFIWLILGAVTLFSGISNLNFEIDQRPTFEKTKSKDGYVVIAPNDVASSVRTVASIDAVPSQVLVKDFFCNNLLTTHQVDSHLVMLNFKICKGLKNVDSVSLFNQTNGFKAQIFKTDGFNYKTDFIQLSKGSNKITVEVVLKDGQKKHDSLVILTGS